MTVSRRRFLQTSAAALALAGTRPLRAAGSLAPTPAPAPPTRISAPLAGPVADYIRAHLPRTFLHDAPGRGQRGVDLPFPYTTPCVPGEGKFSFFFYWDTYFTNLALLRLGHAPTARDNIRNILWLVERHGFMPNHVGLENRSQPPYLCAMVEDYVAATGDRTFLAEAAPGLRREYQFWLTARATAAGLSRYGEHDTAEGHEKFAAFSRVTTLAPTAGLPPAERQRVGANFLAEAESGCDFTPRFSGRCLDHLPPDLNALLHGYEDFFARHSAELGWRDGLDWSARAAHRRERMTRWLWSEERGLFLDYDLARERHSPVASLATFQPLAAGLATPAQAARVAAQLPLFERAHGLAYTEESPDCRHYQWAYPIAWPPSTYIAVQGLSRYGFDADACRLAVKYIATADRLFAETGRLWEKTDVETGRITATEYAAPPMLGWCAGVYVALAEFIRPGG